MKEQDIDQAAEIAGVAKELFKAFEDQLGEVMATQRLASKEANEALAQTRRELRELLNQARQAGEAMRATQEELRRNWQMHVAENSKAAGREIARAFGAEIAAGLEGRIAKLAGEVERVTHRLTGKIALRWTLGLAIAIPLMILLGLNAFMPRPPDRSIPGLTTDQVQEVLSRITPCFPHRNDLHDAHVCVMTDDPPHLTRGPHGEAVVVAHGM
ncbi:MAG: hypothetical protein ACREU3_04940 [Steroidobacteraceae bacterium]